MISGVLVYVCYLGFELFMRKSLGFPDPWSAAGWQFSLVIAGYVGASVSRRSYFAHSFVVGLICMCTPTVIRMLRGLPLEWFGTAAGISTGILYTTWGGLFKSW